VLAPLLPAALFFTRIKPAAAAAARPRPLNHPSKQQPKPRPQIDVAELSGDLAGLTEAQLKTLGDWEAKFREKYGVAGQARGRRGRERERETERGMQKAAAAAAPHLLFSRRCAPLLTPPPRSSPGSQVVA